MKAGHYRILGFVLFFLAALLGMWDLSSPTRDQTHAPSLGVQRLNLWTDRVVSMVFQNTEISEIPFYSMWYDM